MKPSLLILAFLLVGAAFPASAKDVKVSMSKVRFNPLVVQIAVGDTVIWVNDDDRGHTIVADDGSFKSGEIGIGVAFRHTYKAKGEFAYHCEHHPRMRGKVVVSDKGAKDPKVDNRKGD